MTAYELQFSTAPAADGSVSMEVTYGVGEYETGGECFNYFPSRPANVIKETRLLTTAKGKKIQCGIRLVNGTGRGVAWPA